MNIYSIKDHNRELILHISGDDSHPTAPTQVGHDHYTYDANGNPILVENDSLNTERIVKSHGDLEGVYINGAPQGISFHEAERFSFFKILAHLIQTELLKSSLYFYPRTN